MFGISRPLAIRAGMVIALVFGASAISGQAWAGNLWKARQAECISAFTSAESGDQGKLMSCADDFASDAVIDQLPPADKGKIEKGLRWLYDNGSDKGAKVARLALQRLGVMLPVRASKGGGAARAEAPERAKYDPPEAKKADAEAAEKLYKDGVALLKKKKWKEAVAVLNKGLEKNPRSEKILYNLGCGEANMPGDYKPLWTHLQYLADLGTDYSSELLVKSRADEDFEPVREEVEFKRLTGYMRAQIVNTVDDVGEPGVANIFKLFEKLGHRKPDKKDDDKTPLPAPIVQFKPHAKAQTAVIAELLGDPDTKLEPITEGKYDLVIRWGTKVDDKGKPINLGPETADEAVAKARQKQNKALAQPEQAIGKVNKVLDTPGRVISEAGKMKDRVLSVGDKAKGAADKAKDLEKIGDKAGEAMKIKGL